MRNSLSILTLAAASTLAGCSLIPAYEAPPLPVPNAYPAAAQADAAPVSMAWSDYFTDPRLQQLIRIALENNRDLRVAALNVEKPAPSSRLSAPPFSPA